MKKNKRVTWILASAALGLAPGAALAQDWAGGLYFGVFGGIGTVDLPSKDEFDAVYIDGLAALLPPGVAILDAGSSLDDSGEAWGLQIGYAWNPYVAVEAGYVDLGEALYDADMTLSDGFESAPLEITARFKSAGPTLAVVGMLPLAERLELHGRAGIYFGETRIRERFEDPLSGDGDSFELDARSRDAFVGAGGTWNISGDYALRFEYQRFLDVGDEEDTGEQDVDLLSVGVLFR